MEILLKGIAFGLAVAAPVGPIGLLCIRRTLVDGRAAGLATGLGAATADALYGLLVAAGFAATGVLVFYARPLAIGGGLLIVLLGALTLRAFFVTRAVAAADPMPAGSAGAVRPYRGTLSAWATTFALTLSNPMTIVTFVGMIAALGATAAANPAAPYWLVLGVFTGSALWWFFLVHLALVVRSRMTPAALRWLDLGVGALLIVWGTRIVLSAL